MAHPTGNVTEGFVISSFIGSYTNSTTGYSGLNAAGEFIATPPATNGRFNADVSLIRGMAALVSEDPDNNPGFGVNLANIPKAARIVLGVSQNTSSAAAGNKSMQSVTIPRGDVTRYTTYNAQEFLPNAVRFNFAGSTPTVGDKLIFKIPFIDYNQEVKYPVTLAHEFTSTTLSDELIKIRDAVNESLRRVVQDGEVQFVAVCLNAAGQIANASVESLVIVEGPIIPTTLSLSLYPQVKTIDAFAVSSQEAGSSVVNNGWDTIFPGTVVKSEGSLATGFTWDGTTYTTGTFANVAGQVPLGTPAVVREYMRKMGNAKYGNAPIRIQFPDQEIEDLVNDSATYTTVVIGLSKPVKSSLAGREQEHTIVLFLENGSPSTTADFKSYLDAVMNVYQK